MPIQNSEIGVAQVHKYLKLILEAEISNGRKLDRRSGKRNLKVPTVHKIVKAISAIGYSHSPNTILLTTGRVPLKPLDGRKTQQ